MKEGEKEGEGGEKEEEANRKKRERRERSLSAQTAAPRSIFDYHIIETVFTEMCVCVHVCVGVCVCVRTVCALLLWKRSRHCFPVQKSGGTQLKLVMSFPNYGQAMLKPMK